MRRFRLPTIVGIALVAALWCGESRGQDQVIWAKTIDEAWELAQEHERPMLVFITRSGCKYCTQMKSVTYANRQVAREINNRFVPVMVSSQAASELVKQLEIRKFPTTLVISPDYRLSAHITGYVPPNQLQQRLTRAVTEYVALQQPESLR